MPGYTAGSVSAKIELDTTQFKQAIESLKKEVETLKTTFNTVKGKNSLDEEVKKLKSEIAELTKTNENYRKTIDTLREKNKELAKGNKNVSETLKEEQKSLDVTTKKTNELVTANKKLENSNKTASTSVTDYNNKLVSSARKASDALAKFHDKNIRYSAKENKEIKRYTMEELNVLSKLNSALNHKNSHLVPLEYGSRYWDSYTKMRNREKRNGGVGWKEYIGSDMDFSTAFQKRMKELLKDLNVTVSSKLDGDFKKVRDKLTGKMVEYLDVSAIAPFDENYEWITKEKDKLRDLANFEKNIAHMTGGVRRGKYNFYYSDFKKEMDHASRDAYHKYGKKGNIYIKDFIKKEGLDELYKKSQRGLNKGAYNDFFIENASTAFNTFERMLKSTDVSLINTKRHLTETGQALKENIAIMRESKGLTGDISTKKASNVFGGKEKLKELAAAIKDYGNSAERAAQKDKELETAISNLLIKTELEAQLHPKLNEGYRNWVRNIEQVSANAKNATNVLNSFTQTAQKVKTVESPFAKLANTARASIRGLIHLQRGFEIASVSQEQFNQSLNKSGYNVDQYKQRLERVAAELKVKWHSMTVELAKANAAQYKYWQQSRGSVSGYAEPLPIKGYNDYLKSIKEVNQGLAEFKKRQQSINNVAKYTDDNFKVAGQALSRMNKELEREVRTVKLANRQLQLWHKYHRIDRGTYISNMGNINAKLAEQTSNLKQNNGELNKNNVNTRKAGKGITTFNNGVVQTAHSGRILSNTLYQIRGALLSLKMIFTAMGGMALWGFASSIAEGVKDTITAKNEMEAQLKQMFTDKKGYTDWSSIKYFRRELDKLPQTFQKVNKYSVGETASSIGLEFDLTAKQMKDALPVITMIQSEYVRAGRKEAEAALAVKDILQGEFQRLSRETGVGKEELEAYGWSGDKSDVTGILKAVKKAGLDRHWDVFAKKATSLNDVLTITKSRFSELGAEIVDSVTPMVVGGFNAIIDALTGLQNAFGSLSSFWQNFVLVGGGVSLFGGILTALPMVTKGMGLAEVATLGWKKSIATAVLNLNKAEVAQYGFRKALAAVITGTKASELTNIRFTKSIFGRVLGVKQATLAEHGYLSALVESKARLKGQTQVAISAAAGMGNLRQKIIYLAKGEIVANEASATWGKTIKSLITSTKLWRLALLSITGVGLVAYLSSVAAWADTVKSRVETYHKVLAEGKDEIKNLQDRIDFYDKKLAGMSKSDTNYDLFTQNQETLKHNLESTKAAYKYAKEIKKETKEQSEIHKGMISRGTEESYRIAGVKSILERSTDYQQVKKAAYDLKKAEDESYKFSYQSLQHINEKVGLMKQDADLQAKGITDEKKRAEFEKEAQDKRIEYIAEYSSKAEEAAQHLKEFNQGDITAGMYYLMDLASLKWIDLWNDDHFLQFWKSLNDTWKDLQPTLQEIVKDLTDLGHLLLDFFSTKQGQIIGGIAVLGLGLGIIGLKLKGVWDKLKPVRDIVGSLKDKWKDAGDEAEKASEKMGGKVDPEGKVVNKYPQSRGEWWQDTKGQIYNDATKYARAAVAIAAGMLLISEAVLMLTVPMWSLAQTGKYFKAVEPNVRDGIDGLKLIAPVMLVLLPPVIALALVMDKFGPDTMQIVKGSWKAAVGIAAGMLLVAEAVAMMNAPLLAIASVGYVFNWQKDAVLKGKEALQLVTDCLVSLAPTIPLFIAGIALMALAFIAPEIGIPALAATALGIGASMLLVAEAVVGLNVPLAAIAQTGQNYPDLSAVKQGAEALKITAEALGYVEEAMNALAGIAWASLSNAVAQLVGVDIGVDLTQLSGKGGFFEQLSTFTKDFNDNVNITPINEDKVKTLSDSATGIDSVKTALNTVKDALKDLPNFNVDNRSTNEKYQDAAAGKEATEGISNYFEQLKEPITQLNTFISNFNALEIEPVNEDKVAIIQSSSNFISTVKSAIDNVKAAVGAGVDTQWNANVQTSGILGAGINLLVGNAGQSSSIKSGLDELYNCVKDIMDFNTRITGLTSEGSGDTSGIQNSSNMVSALQTQINSLKTTLSGAIPTIQSTAKGMGTAIITGFQSGLVGLDSAAKTAGGNLGTNAANGFKDNFKIQDIATGEVDATLTAISGKDQEFYDKGKAMGEAFQRGYKDGGGINSPGYAAQAMQQEIGYMEQYINDGMINLPQMAYNLGNLVSSNFNFDLGLGNLQLPDLSQFQQGLSSVIPMVTGVKDSVSLQFDTMKTNIGGAFSGILSNTKLNMGSMLSATTKNIGAIRTSWKGMQSALISSAEYIKTQTGQKIDKLKTNMGDFWNKIQHPAQLIGSAGGHQGTIRRRYGGSSMLKGLYAGGTSSKTPNIKFDLQKYLECMMNTGGNCYAGGWSFNWNKPIQTKFNGWNTHFGKYKIDDFVKVGKFENDNFPVRNNADIAKAYIFDTIRATNYAKYFNSNFGEDPVAALAAGAFNCWDGTNIILAIARAFGFEGSRGHGTWNGIGHVWADIPGLGIIDPTAIQNRGTFTSSAVKGYHAGGTTTRNSSSNMNMGNTYGDINITINNNGKDMTVNEKKIDRETSKKIWSIINPSLNTGL